MTDNNRFSASIFYLGYFIACVKVFEVIFFFKVTFDVSSTKTELWKAGLRPPKFEFFSFGPGSEGTSPRVALESPV